MLDNPNLIYAILRSHQKFQKLAEFSLDNAMIEIERLRQIKEASSITNRMARHSIDEIQPDSPLALSEKAKGKLPEASLSRVSSTSSLAQPPHSPLRQSSVSSIASLLPGAKNGFIPTDDWVKKKLEHIYIYVFIY